jgi:hypothetical protein
MISQLQPSLLDNDISTTAIHVKKNLHHNIVYSKSPVYNNLNGPGVNIIGPSFT